MSAKDEFHRRNSALHQLAEQAHRMDPMARPSWAYGESIAQLQREIDCSYGPLRSAIGQLGSDLAAVDTVLESYRQSLLSSFSQFQNSTMLATRLAQEYRSMMEPYELAVRSATMASELGLIMPDLAGQHRALAEAIAAGRTWGERSLNLFDTVRHGIDRGRAVREVVEQQTRLASLPDLGTTIRELTSSWEVLARSPVRDVLEAIHGRGLVEQATVAAASYLGRSADPAMDELRRASFLFDAVSIMDEAEDFWDGSEAERPGLATTLQAILASVADHLGRAKTRLEQESILTILIFVLALLSFVSDRFDSAGHDAAVRSMERGFAEVTSKLDRLTEAVERRDAPRLDDSNEPRFVMVIRNANVREFPSIGAKVTDKLYAKQPAELVDVLGEWFLLRYYDYLSGSTKAGWIYSRLVRVSPAECAPRPKTVKEGTVTRCSSRLDSALKAPDR